MALITLSLGELQAVNITWTNELGGVWSQASNWSPNQVPTAPDKVFINLAGTYTVILDATATNHNVTLGGTSGMQSLMLSNAFLMLNGTLTVNSRGQLLVAGNILQGPGSVIVDGTMRWVGGSVRVPLTIKAGATLHVSGSEPKVLAAALSNAGTLVWSGEDWLLDGDISFQNSGLFDWQSAHSMRKTAGATNLVFRNTGVLRKSSNATDMHLTEVDLISTGTVDVQTGNLILQAGSHSLGGSSIIDGAGRLIVDGARLTLSGTPTANGVLEIRNGQVLGTNTLTGSVVWRGGEWSGQTAFAGSLEWRGGRYTGALNISAGSTLQLFAGSEKQLRGTLHTAGTSFLNDQSITCTNGASITNSGVMSFHGETPWIQAGGSRSRLVNKGTLRRTAGAEASILSGVELQNHGTIDIQAGVLSLASGLHTLQAGGSFTGAGRFLIDGAAVTAQGVQTLSVLFELRSGSWAGTNSIAGDIEWRGGTVSGSITNLAGSHLRIGGAAPKLLHAAILVNVGEVLWTGSGPLTLANGSVIRNYGMFEIQSGQAIARSGAEPCSVINHGTLRVNNSAQGEGFQGLTLQNFGTIEGSPGQLAFRDGTYAFNNGSRLAGSTEWLIDGATVTLSGNITNEAPLHLNSGVLAGNATLTGGLIWTGGEITGQLTVKGAVAWHGGRLSGTLTSPVGSSLELLAGSTKEVAGTLSSAGTAALHDQSFTCTNGAAITNSGVMTFSNENPWVQSGGARSRLVNTGTLRRTGSLGVSVIDQVELRNSGLIEVTEGTLSLSGNQHSFEAGGRFTGTGLFTIDGASVLVRGAQTISVPFALRSGSWTGTNNVIGTVDWTGGTIRGFYTNAAGSHLRLSGSGSKTLDAATLINLGQITWTDAGPFILSNGAVVNNFGVFEIDTAQNMSQGAGAASTFINRGVLRKSSDEPLAGFSGVGYQNYGSIEILQGTIVFTGGNFTFNSGSRFVGPGEWLIDGGTVTLSGNITNDAPLHLNSGVLAGNATLTGGLIWTGGEITGQLTVKGAVAWHGGRLSGTLTSPVGSSLELLAGSTKEVAGTLSSAGTAALHDQNFTCTNGAAITNSGVMTFSSENPWVQSGGARSRLVNTGTLRRTGNSGVTLMTDVELVQQGTLDIATGAVIFSANKHSFLDGSRVEGAGRWAVDGAELHWNGAILSTLPLELISGTVTGRVVYTGDLNWAGGTMAGDAVLNSTVAWAGGLLQGSLTLPTNRVLNVEPGSLKGMDGAVLTNAGTMTIAATETIQCDNGSRLVNLGLLLSHSDDPFRSAWGTRSRIENMGTLRKTGGGVMHFREVELRQGGLLEIQGGAVSYSSSTHTFLSGARFSGTGSNIIAGATVTLQGLVTNSLPLYLESGTLSANGSAIGTLLWTGGQITGALTIPPNSLFELSGNSRKILSGTSHELLGTSRVKYQGLLLCDNGVIVNNRGLLELEDGATLTLNIGATGATFNNFGTLRHAGNGGTNVFDKLALNNSGVIDLRGGALRFPGGSHTFSAGSSVLGPGAVCIAGATLNLNGAITSSASLSLESGAINANGTLNGVLAWSGGQLLGLLTTSQPLEWSGGDLTGTLTVSGGGRWTGGKVIGTLLIPSGATLNVRSGGIRQLKGGVIQNAGLLSVEASAPVQTDGGGSVNNTGVFETWSETPLLYMAGLRPVLNNSGTFRKQETNTMIFSMVELRNTGRIEIPGGIVLLAAQAHTLSHGSVISGPGLIRVDGATVNGAGTIILSNELQFASGTWVGTPTLRGRTVWSGGTFADDVTIPVGSVLSVTDAAPKILDNNKLTLAGTMTITAGAQIQLKKNVDVINNGLLEYHSDAPWLQVGTERPKIDNSGVLRKLSAGSTTFGGIELDCTGTLDIRQGNVVFASSTHTLQNAQITGPGFVRIAGAIVRVKGNVVSSQALQLDSGELSDYGTLQGGLTWTGGELSGGHEISGGVAWTAGELTGQLTIPTNGTLAFTGTGLKQMNSGVIENLGVMSGEAGSSLRCDNASIINNRGFLDFPDGFQITHLLSGRPALNNYGVMSATNGVSPIRLQAELRQYSGARFDAGLIARPLETNSGLLQSSYSAVLAGELRVLLQNDFVPLEGDRFVILAGAPVTGSFSKFSGHTRLMSPVYTSSNVVMICEAPEITVPPLPRAIVLSNDATFNVTATGTTPLSYQWFSNGNSLPGATNASLTLANVPKSSEGNYFVVITNVWGAVTSSPVLLTVNVPVTITSQPRSLTAIDGTDVTFEVTALGTTPITYQWRFEGLSLPGQTNATLQLKNITAADAGDYDVLVRNVVGSVLSAEARLTILVRPTIVVQPTSRAAVLNLGTTFSVSAAGTTPLGYQWKFNGVNIAGANASTLQLTQLKLSQAGDYSVLITNIAGSVLSQPARLVVNEPVVILIPPRNTSVIEAQSTSLVVHATGTAPLTYQWRKSGVALVGQTNATLHFASAQASHAGRYTVVVANLVGPVTSSEATLTVNIPPRITQQPQNILSDFGDDVRLEVQVTGTTPLFYQWRRNGMIIPTAIGSSWQIKDLNPENAGTYTVTITNMAGSVTSGPAVVTLRTAPRILSQPTSQTVFLGTNVVFTVEATGVPAPTYQWRLNNVNVPGATNASFAITNVQAKHSGFYSVVVANSAGSIISQQAELTVVLPSLPFADNFGGAGILFSQSGAGRSFNAGATHENGEPRHGRKPAERSIWISWWAPANGIATFSTAGSDFDTLLAVYQGEALTALNPIARDDDSGGFHTSTLSFNAQAGSLYKIAVDGYKGATGEVVLGWEMVVTQEKIPQITGAPLDTTGNTNQMVQLSVAFDAFDVTAIQWFFQGVPIPGATSSTLILPALQTNSVGGYNVRLTAANGRTVVSAVADVQINTDGFTEVAARNKLGDAVEAALIPSTAPIGPTSPAHPGAYGAGGSGSGVARGYSGTQIFSTTYNTTDMDEPAHCGVSGGASSWFVYQPLNNGTLEIDTDGSSFDTVLAVYTGDGTLDNLVPVACDNDSGADGFDSKVTFAVTAQTVYYIAVDGVNGARGTVVLHYLLGQAPMITASPASRSLAPSGSTVLTVQATGNPSPTYQWFHKGAAIFAATNASYTIANFDAAQEGSYHATAMNVIGTASSAAAVVLLNSPMRVVSCTLPDPGTVRLCVIGPAGTMVRIDKSTNLVDWLPLSTNGLLTGVLEFNDTTITNTPVRYYRALPQP